VASCVVASVVDDGVVGVVVVDCVVGSVDDGVVGVDDGVVGGVVAGVVAGEDGGGGEPPSPHPATCPGQLHTPTSLSQAVPAGHWKRYCW